MALIRCMECSGDVSDRAATCPNCGAPVDPASAPQAPSQLAYENDVFSATSAMMADLAKAAVERCEYRVNSADAVGKTVTFTTGMTMGSWSGVSGTVGWQEVAPYRFTVAGQGKQNVQGGQVLALNLFDEANGKVRNVIEQMKVLAGGRAEQSAPPSGCAITFIALSGAAAIATHVASAMT